MSSSGVEQRQAAERAIEALAGALATAGLPPLPGLSAGRVSLTPTGVHVELGGCGVRTLQAIADFIAAHARPVPAWVAELPSVRRVAASRKSAMTIRAYRIADTGERIELARSTITQGEPYQREITCVWPDCACRRCAEQTMQPAGC